EDADPLARGPQLGERLVDVLVVGARARHQRHAVDGAARRPGQLAHLRDEGGRQAVDHEPAEVLERGGRLAPPRPREPGDHHVLGHAGKRTETRSRSRGIVAAAWYSAARARNPGGGAGSCMRVIRRPLSTSAFTYR